MKVLQAKVNWMEGYMNPAYLQLLVDKIPRFGDLLWHRQSMDQGKFYWALDEGYVAYLYDDPTNHHGFGGATHVLLLAECCASHEQALVRLVGPWSSSAPVASQVIGEPVIHVSLTDLPEAYQRGYTFITGNVTLALAQEAVLLAGATLVSELVDSDGPAVSGEQAQVVTAGLAMRNPVVSWRIVSDDT